MKSSTVLSYIATLASSVAAVQFTNSAVQPATGESFTLTWTDASGPVDISVVTGPNENALTDVYTVGTGLTGGSTTFTLPASNFASGVYAFKIVDGDDDNFSARFSLIGTGSASTSGASTTAASTSAASTTGSTTTEATTDATTTTTTTDAETTETSTTLATSTTASGNSTTTSARSSATSGSSRSSGSASGTTTGSSVSTNVPGAAAGLAASPVGLILMSAAAMFFLN
ncbi:hypothetical protein BROUX41_006448 [Berkeleyomyces rouxiae]|uniref:uncharacterized protein n=1 Tax=Berkeleyomyces rouxiae TaxID=2035830 RepID=UPI003B7D101D